MAEIPKLVKSPVLDHPEAVEMSNQDNTDTGLNVGDPIPQGVIQQAPQAQGADQSLKVGDAIPAGALMGDAPAQQTGVPGQHGAYGDFPKPVDLTNPDEAMQFAGDTAVGAVHGAEQVGNMLQKAVARPARWVAPNSTIVKGWNQALDTEWGIIHPDAPTSGEAFGQNLETIAEWMVGEGEVEGALKKGMPLVEKLPMVGKAMEALKANPSLYKYMLGRIMKASIHQGIMGAGEGFVHSGGDAGATARGAVGGAAAGTTGEVINLGLGALGNQFPKASKALANAMGRNAMTRTLSRAAVGAGSGTLIGGAAGFAQTGTAEGTKEGAEQGALLGGILGGGAQSYSEGRRMFGNAVNSVLRPQMQKVGTTSVPVRNEGIIAGQAQKMINPERMEDMAVNQTGPAVAQGIGETAKAAAGTEDDVTTNREDQFGLHGVRKQLIDRAKEGFQAVDKWSNNKLSDYQTLAEDASDDMSTEGKQKFREAMDAIDSLYSVYAKKFPDQAHKIDQDRIDWKRQLALKRIDATLTNSATESSDNEAGYQLKQGDQLGDAIHRLVTQKKGTTAGEDVSLLRLAGFNDEQIDNMQTFGKIVSDQAQIPKFSRYTDGFAKLIMAGLGFEHGGVWGSMGTVAAEEATARVSRFVTDRLLGKILTTPRATESFNTLYKAGAGPVDILQHVENDIQASDPSWWQNLGTRVGNMAKAVIDFNAKKGQAGAVGADIGNLPKSPEEFAAREQEDKPFKTFEDAKNMGWNQDLHKQATDMMLAERKAGKAPEGMSASARAQQIFEQLQAAKAEEESPDYLSKGAADYAQRHDLGAPDTNKVPLDPRRAEIADAYSQMEHDPSNPRVAGSYEALKDEVKQQYNYATQKLGINIVPTDTDPYKSYEEMREDVLKNHTLKVWRNTVGDDTSGGNPLQHDHPMSEVDPDTGENYGTLFRAVHDLFGHAAEGNDFSEHGEENAWNMHRQMFSDKAVPAMTTETKGQTSWFFNHEGVRNGEPLGRYADQKAGLLPREHTGVGNISQRLVEKYGTTDDPTKAAFILNDGTMVPLGAREHDRMLAQVSRGVTREDFVADEGAVRTRNRTTGHGPEVVFSIPRNVTPVQVSQMESAVKRLGRPTINVVIEQATANGRSVHIEDGTPADVQNALDQLNGKPSRVTPGVAPEAGAGPQTMAQRAREIFDAQTQEQRWTPERIMDTVKDGGRYAILQAENPQNKRVSDQYNAFLTAQLKKDLESQGYAAIPVTGNTKDVAGVQEHAFFVPGITAPDAAEMGRKYNQMGIFHGQKGLIDLNKGTITPPDTKAIKFDDDARAQQYYTTVGGRDFSIPTIEESARPESAAPAQRVGATRPNKTVNKEVVYQPHDENRGLDINDVLTAKNVDNFAHKVTDGVPSMNFEPEGNTEFFPEEKDAELSPKEKIQKYISQAKDNIKAMFKAVPEDMRNMASQWYEGAHNLTKQWAADHGISHEQAAAITAMFSPQNPWEHNLDIAKAFMDIYRDSQNQPWSDEMDVQAKKFADDALKVAAKSKNPQLAMARTKLVTDAIDQIRGKKLSELRTDSTDPNEIAAAQYRKGMWIMLHDKSLGRKLVDQYNPKGEVVGRAVNAKSGQFAKPMWFASPQTVANAVSVIEDGSIQNIDEQLGDNHKVRTFYNSIADPWNPKNDPTVDTHAVGVAHFNEVGSEDPAVKANFGGVTRGETGTHGTYTINAEAYKQATKELNKELGLHLRPNQVQSVTWEGIKNLFGNKDNFEVSRAVSDAWKEFQHGEITADAARKRIIEAAGGFDRPAWANSPSPATENESRLGLHEGEQNPADERELPRPGVPDQGTNGGGGGNNPSGVQGGRHPEASGEVEHLKQLLAAALGRR